VKILLTGSTGFMGGRLKNALSVGHDVHCFQGDILGDIPHDEYDAVVHLVGLNDSQCQKDPVRGYDINVIGTHNLLKSVKTKKIIYFSTIHVYGYPATGTITEETQVNPKSVYAISHYLAERMVLQHPGGVVLRLANGWGCPAKYNRDTAWIIVMNAMCRKAIENKKIDLYAHINEDRNFITVSNVCLAVHHMLNTSKTGVFNLGSAVSTRIVEMAHRVSDRCEALFGYSVEISMVDGQYGMIYHPKRDEYHAPLSIDYRIDKLRAAGFTPVVDTDDEIDDLLLMINHNARSKNEKEKENREHRQIYEAAKP
jgi:UDP-glucose 4-epimerase